MPNYWLLATTRENYEVTRDLGFTVQGVKSKDRKKARRMEPNDRVLYYLQPTRQFVATATITSAFWEDHQPLWRNGSAGEDFPYRVQVRPDIVLGEKEALDGDQLGPSLHYVQRWVPEDWYLAFVENLHLLPQRDFSLIEEEMRKVTTHRRLAAATA